VRSASIVITNYNYGRFLDDAIRSALAQTFANTEAIVVDDGSTDGSREIITSYGDRILAVFNEHRGQAASFNAGFRASSGDVVCFLDADDLLLPRAIEEALPHFDDPQVTKVHWPLHGIDEAGKATGELIPELPLAEGDLREDVLAKGPGGYVWSPTSGNAWSRQLLERIFPMPEAEYVTCADTYLSLWAPLLGRIKAVPTVQALYREHGSNNRYRISEEHITRFVEHSREMLGDYLRTAGVTVDIEAWRDAFRWPDRDQAMEELARLLSPGERFVLVDNGQLGEHFALRDCATRFDEGTDAPHALEHLRRSGAGLFAIAWPAFDWLESRPALHAHVTERYAPILSNERLVVYDLRCER
jgi:glycosyltransferase involved in cell wall biosynthesis